MISYILSAVLVSAIVTYALRGIVFILFRDDKRMPHWLEKLGELLPSAVMAVLVVYCLKSVRYDFSNTGFKGIIAAIITAISYKIKHNTFLSIIVGTAVYMVLIRI